MNKKYPYIILFLVFSLLVVFKMLLPGYVLTEDLVFAPHTFWFFGNNGLNNNLLVIYVLRAFNIFFTGWLSEKIFLVILFFFMGYIPFRFLPGLKSQASRIAAAFLYVCNPFVYERMLAGQWGVLYGYAFLPLFLHLLFAFGNLPTIKKGLKLGLSIFLICVFSIHFFVMIAVISIIYGVYKVIGNIQNRKTYLWPLLRNSLLAAIFLAILCSYWIIPALHRQHPVEQTFNAQDFSVFAASAHSASSHIQNVPVVVNLLSLNGFWGESQSWHQYFLWPQEHVWFWVAFSLVMLICLVGFIFGLRKKEYRSLTIGTLVLGIVSVILATGAANTPFQSFNLYLYNHVPFWSGFRDSQKFTGITALAYAILFGIGADTLYASVRIKKPALASTVATMLILIPLFYGFFVLFGFHEQLPAVNYPESWYTAETILSQNPSKKALVLPWHGYFSLAFDRNLIVANPAQVFYGTQAVQSKNIELGSIYDEQTDPTYKTLDQIVRGSTALNSLQALAFLKSQGIGYILYFQDIKKVDNFNYNFVLNLPKTTILDSSEVEMYVLN